MDRQRSYKKYDQYGNVIQDEPNKPDPVLSASCDMVKRSNKPKPKPFVPADPRCKKCYYWQSLSGYNNNLMGCHFALIEGKCRSRSSPIECDSFKDKSTAPKRVASFDSVPMTQWGLGGLNIVGKSQR